MNEQNDLAQKHAIIERIKQVFPKNPRVKGKKWTKITNGLDQLAEERLQDMLQGKRWEDVIGHQSIGYNMTEIDHLFEITDEAYRYYLPAFLVASLLNPGIWFSYQLAIEKMWKISSRFTFEQLETFIAYLEFQAQFLRIHSRDRDAIEVIEDMMLRLMIRRDEVVKG